MSAEKPPLLFTALVQPEGQTFDAWTDRPLLLSAEQGGIDWPSSCRNGTCRTCIGKLEQGSVRYELGLFRSGDDPVYATGYFVDVFVDRADGRPRPIPPAIRAHLEKILRAPAAG